MSVNPVSAAVLSVLKFTGWLLVLAFFIRYNYDGNRLWFSSIMVTGVVLLYARLAMGKNWLNRLGLVISPKHFLWIVFVFLLSLLLMGFWANHISVSTKNPYNSYFSDGHSEWFIYTFFRSLNEEILFGFVPLTVLARIRVFRSRVVRSALVALVFAALHFVAYQWIFPRGGTLGVATLISLSGFFFLRNNFILAFRHIGFSTALHTGFAFVIFGGYFDRWWREYQIFNGLFNFTGVALVSSLLALLSLLLFARKFTRFPMLKN